MDKTFELILNCKQVNCKQNISTNTIHIQQDIFKAHP